MLRHFFSFSLATGLFLLNPAKSYAQVGEEVLLPAAALCPETIVTCTVVGVVVIGGTTHYIMEHGGRRYIKHQLGYVVRNSTSILSRIEMGILRIHPHNEDSSGKIIYTNNPATAKKECDKYAKGKSYGSIKFIGKIIKGKHSGQTVFICSLDII